MTEHEYPMPYTVYPPAYRSAIEPDLSAILHMALEELQLDTGYLGFIEGDGQLRYLDLIQQPGHSHPLDVNFSEGIVGLGLAHDQVFCWPDDLETVELPNGGRERHRNNDPKAKREIFGPLHFQGKITGVLWFASYIGGVKFTERNREVLRKYVSQVENLLTAHYKSREESVDQRLLDLASRCLEATKSDRGYLAVLRSDKDLQYFMVGEDIERFLPLSRFEGLCGRAFQTGELIYAPNVLEERSYVASHPQVRSELVIPIIEDQGEEGHQTIGIINLESYHPDHYNETSLSHIKSIASGATHLIQLYRRLEEDGGDLQRHRRSKQSDSSSDERNAPSLVIVWDPDVLTPDEYARLVAALGDLVRASGGTGIERIRSRGFGVPCNAGALS